MHADPRRWRWLPARALVLDESLILIAGGVCRLVLMALPGLFIQPHTIGVHQRTSRYICVKCFLSRVATGRGSTRQVGPLRRIAKTIFFVWFATADPVWMKISCAGGDWGRVMLFSS